ncbi:MAG: hypothetical protein HC876_12255 [Chloroflexaceae bacterium]|nr:hypothetical protein [Chloroflexaceae bacterium]
MTGTAVQVVRGLGRQSEIEAIINQLRFQTDTMRQRHPERMRQHLTS